MTPRDAVLDYVNRHLTDRRLSVRTVCRQFRISPRTLHNVFADSELTFAATVRALRLERCAQILADPASDTTITEVGLAHGFDAPESFSRAFRRRFGVSPRQMRGSVRVRTSPRPRTLAD